MSKLKSFSPNHLTGDAEHSGFFQCPKCGLIWFGRADIEKCPEDRRHGAPLHVVLYCRVCDAVVSAERLSEHLSGSEHTLNAPTLAQHTPTDSKKLATRC